MPIDWWNALFGGVLIGTSVSLMLVWNGRVTGISGIVRQVFTVTWAGAFVLGLLSGGLLLVLLNPAAFGPQPNTPLWAVLVSGFLVGFGTLLGKGCTSGHGVCGISRFSLRSIVATIVFIAFGMLSVFVFKSIGGQA